MTLRIAHLSDPHFGGEAVDAVWAAADWVARFDPAVTVISGDLTLDGAKGQFKEAARWLAALPGDRLVTPGNHDTPYWSPIMRVLAPFARYRRHIGRADLLGLDTPGVSVRVLNSARGVQWRLNWSRGALSESQWRSLNWNVDAQARLRVFACHHPLLEVPGAPVQGGVANAARARAHLVSSGVELALSGHLHNPFALPLDGAETRGWAVGAGTLSQRLRGAPASFNTIIVDDDAFRVDALGWTGEHFEVIQSWRLPRRKASGPGA